MQTFVPYSNLEKCARSLDRLRLGKQRHECLTILNVLAKKKSDPSAKVGWANHPAVLMWRGHEDYLRLYAIAICVEWKRRGYDDQTLPAFLSGASWDRTPTPPRWWGDERVHESHRSKLIQKLPSHYEPQFSTTPNNLDYFWPTKEGYSDA